jgi:hypothetical protein
MRPPKPLSKKPPSSCPSGGNCYTHLATASISVGTDTMATTIPLSTLGNADGRLNYRVFAGAPANATITTDVMPDMTLPPRVSPDGRDVVSLEQDSRSGPAVMHDEAGWSLLTRTSSVRAVSNPPRRRR